LITVDLLLFVVSKQDCPRFLRKHRSQIRKKRHSKVAARKRPRIAFPTAEKQLMLKQPVISYHLIEASGFTRPFSVALNLAWQHMPRCLAG
jgi:hypothetical protein